MRISDTDRRRAVAAVHAVKRGDSAAFNGEMDDAIRDGGWMRFAYALAELGEVTDA
jgi:hypothetical protein